MKTVQKFGLALLVLSIAISCKQSENSFADEAVTEVEKSAEAKSVVSSSAAFEHKNSNRKFIRTADIKFKVKNVPQSTYMIENATAKFGGFVTNTNLQSSVSEKDETKISIDSSVVTTKFTVENNITIRVPNTKLDTIIKTIAKQIDFLDYRVIKADDVSLKLLGNEQAQNRNSKYENRLAKAIDEKGKKLNDIVTAEDSLEIKKEQNDNSKLENLSLNDQINYSTLTIQLYQLETVRQEKIANTIVYRQSLGSQIFDSIKTGWYLLEGIISFIAQLWSLILIAFLAWLGYRKFTKIKI